MLGMIDKILNKQDVLNTGMEPLVVASIASTLVGAGTAAYSATKKPKTPNMNNETPDMGSNNQLQETLDTNNITKQKARQTAKKGVSSYRIPLQAKSTGINVSGGSGLKI